MEAQSTITKRMIRTSHTGSLWVTLGLWFAATAVNFLLAWYLAPLVIERLPIPASLAYWSVMALGTIWQMGILLFATFQQERTLSWTCFLGATRLNRPVDPKSGQANARILWRGWRRWWLVALIMGISLLIPVILVLVRRYLPMTTYTSPLLVWPAYSGSLELTSPEYTGNWWMLPVSLLGWAIFAFFEELLFRGLLLSRLNRDLPRHDCALNALLFGLYSIYQFWLIPFRFFEGWVLARAARRYQSTWMAIVVRGVEGVGVGLLILLGITARPLTASTRPFTFPYIANRPVPAVRYAGQWSTIPTYDPKNTAPFQVDLRGADVSAANLNRRGTDLAFADFDTLTVWPVPERMPAGFVPTEVLETGKNPGLSLRSLHAKSITGKGVGVAIVDQALLTEHMEYADRLRWYEELPGYPSPAQEHGPAVASIALGKTVGVAPEADLYFISGCSTGFSTFWAAGHDYAQSIRRIIQINKNLPANRKIRVISMSVGWLPSTPGYEDVSRAVREAEAAGMMFVNAGYATGLPKFTYLSGLGREITADPDDFHSYGPGLWWANSFYTGGFHNTGLRTYQGYQFTTLLFPMDSRTTASETGANDYTFNRGGGQSWVVPYIAGLYALAAQVDPSITPEQFWQVVIQTGEILTVEHDEQVYTLGMAVNPERLIERLKQEAK